MRRHICVEVVEEGVDAQRERVGEDAQHLRAQRLLAQRDEPGRRQQRLAAQAAAREVGAQLGEERACRQRARRHGAQRRRRRQQRARVVPAARPGVRRECLGVAARRAAEADVLGDVPLVDLVAAHVLRGRGVDLGRVQRRHQLARQLPRAVLRREDDG